MAAAPAALAGTDSTADDWLYAVTVASGGEVWAVGGQVGAKCEAALAEAYTGGAWKVVKVPNPGGCSSSNANALYGVTTTSGGNVYAVGETDISTLVEEQFSGTWSVVPSGN